MKKLFGFLGIAIVLSFSFVSMSPAPFVQASSDITEQEALQQSRTINYTVYFDGNVTPPKTYRYNDGTWSGTLYRNEYQFDGVRTIASYSGTVYCSGNCPIPPRMNEE